MTQRGPANGFYWTAREMMMRRDTIRWRNNHAFLRCAPFTAIIIGAPVGTYIGLVALVVSFLVQGYYAYNPFADGRHQFSAPITIQRVGAGLTMATGICLTATGSLLYVNAVVGAGLWLLGLQIVNARASAESEIDRANREATHVEETWIKE